MSQLSRLHRTLIAATREFSRVETDGGYEAEIQDAAGIGSTFDGREPFASAFRIRIIDPPVGVREFTVTISETTARR